MDIPCLIGDVFGCAYGGWFSDKFVNQMTRRNGGIQEAEFRLWLLLPASLFFRSACFCLELGARMSGLGRSRTLDWPSLGWLGECGSSEYWLSGRLLPKYGFGGNGGCGCDQQYHWDDLHLLGGSMGPTKWASRYVDSYRSFVIYLYGDYVADGGVWKTCRKLTAEMYYRFLTLRDGL